MTQTAGRLTDAQRELLSRRVQAARTGGSAGIPRIQEAGPVAASLAQERLWLIGQLDGPGHQYNVYHVLRIEGDLDVSALRAALDELVRRHESLRTTFAPAGTEPEPGLQPGAAGDPGGEQSAARAAAVQIVTPAAPADLVLTDLTRHPQDADQVIRAACREPFDLAAGVLRAHLLTLGPASSVLVFVIHHIATDGWSTPILARELAALYGVAAGRSADRTGPADPAAGPATDVPDLAGAAGLSQAPVRYRDFAAWQRQRMTGPAARRDAAYWRERLTGQPHVLDLPADHPRTPASRYQGADITLPVPAALTGALRELASQESASLYMVLAAAVRALLHAHSAQDRFIMATSIAGRDRPELEDVVGCFINTLALAGDLSGDPSFRETVRRERATILGAFEHQELPFERLVREMAVERDLARSPLAQVFVQLDQGTSEGWVLPGLRVTEQKIPNDVAKFDLSFFFRDQGADLQLTLEYATGLYDEATAGRLAARLVRLLESVTANPDAPLSACELLPEPERTLMLSTWNDTATGFPATLLPELLTARAAESGDRPAVRCGERTLSYTELERRSNQLARYLRGQGVQRADRVAVFLGRELDLPVALLAVLKAGAAYVPLNPGEPADRIALILQDARPALVLTQPDLVQFLPPGTGGIRLLAEQEADLARQDPAPPPGRPGPADLAYVIFTSGSTGRPKGVAVPHGALVNFLSAMAREPGITPDDVLVAVTTPSFDIAALELFLPLIAGGQVVIAEKEATLDADQLRSLIAACGGTMLQATPATWRLLAAGPELPGLTALVGGEALTVDVAAMMARVSAAVWNMYGPTETTIWSTVRRIGPPDLAGGSATMGIGRPIANTSCYIVDELLRLVPAGVPGELLIGGHGVTRGYFGRPGQTADRFVPDPYGPPGSRLYRTGDLARYASDGNIEFLGRNDYQVKVRGYRIETSEVEMHLATHPAVSQVAVTAHEFGPGDVRLVCYLTAPGTPPDADELRGYLAGRLPDYMIPGMYIPLPEFPLTPNRKIDRKALPEPAARVAAGAGQAPRTPVEHQVAGVWATLLGEAVPGVHADFFSLGGHSLLAVTAMNQLNAAFGTALPVRTLFEASTVSGLADRFAAARADEAAAAIPRADRTGPIPASFAQQRLWFLDQLTPGSPEYNIPVELSLSGPLDVSALRDALGLTVARHESLRSRLRCAADGALLQVIEPAGPFTLPVDDLTQVSGTGAGPDQAAQADQILAAAAAAPFDLATDVLLRARLVRLAPEQHILALTLHHAAADGASLHVLRRELSACYGALTRGAMPDLRDLPAQYADVASWQRDLLTAPAAEADLDYWRATLDGLAPLDLPVDRPRPPVRRADAAAYRFTLGADIAAGVTALARAQATTPFVVLLAAYQAALAQYAGQTDIAVSTAVSGRTTAWTQDLIGMLINTLVLRADLAGQPRFRSVVDQAERRVREAMAHQDLPFERVVDELATDRDLSRPPLTAAHFTLDAATPDQWALPGLDVRRRPERIIATRHELALGLSPVADGLDGIIEYSPALMDATTVAAFAASFADLLRRVLADPASAVEVSPRPGHDQAPPEGDARPATAASDRAAPGSGPAARSPEGLAEEVIAEIWADLLGEPVADAQADFFGLGGHSLLAARLRMRMQDTFSVDLPLDQLFSLTTVAGQARAVVEQMAGAQGAAPPAGREAAAAGEGEQG